MSIKEILDTPYWLMMAMISDFNVMNETPDKTDKKRVSLTDFVGSGGKV